LNAFQSFLSSRPFGFITTHDIDELVRLHRLCPVIVRCGCVRFTCAAQYLKAMLAMVEASGDYVRDCCVTAEAIEAADQWLPEAQHLPRSMPVLKPTTTKLLPAPKRSDFNEADCGGVFDGFGVVSDADPGL
jgi:hypothetical protein